MTPLHRLLDGARDTIELVDQEQRKASRLVCLNLLLAAGANPNLEQLGDGRRPRRRRILFPRRLLLESEYIRLQNADRPRKS